MRLTSRSQKVTVNYAGFGVAIGEQGSDTLILGEGFETVASFHKAVPQFSALAGLTRYHTSVLCFPENTKRIILAQDNDEAGFGLQGELAARCEASGVDFVSILPLTNDFNADHMAYGFLRTRVNILDQLVKWSLK